MPRTTLGKRDDSEDRTTAKSQHRNRVRTEAEAGTTFQHLLWCEPRIEPRIIKHATREITCAGQEPSVRSHGEATAAFCSLFHPCSLTLSLLHFSTFIYPFALTHSLTHSRLNSLPFPHQNTYTLFFLLIHFNPSDSLI